jgi:hypothetical protein
MQITITINIDTSGEGVEPVIKITKSDKADKTAIAKTVKAIKSETERIKQKTEVKPKDKKPDTVEHLSLRTCLYCGGEFMPNSWNHYYDSPDCQRAYKKMQLAPLNEVETQDKDKKDKPEPKHSLEKVDTTKRKVPEIPTSNFMPATSRNSGWYKEQLEKAAKRDPKTYKRYLPKPHHTPQASDFEQS